jgi:uncharacterized protein (UPF0264 family)
MPTACGLAASSRQLVGIHCQLAVIMNYLHQSGRPGLLVSVRNAVEAIEALAGGADVVDIKEPNHGALGAASSETIADVVRTVRGCASVTAAMGELNDIVNAAQKSTPLTIPTGVSLFKIGLAGCRDLEDWQMHWQQTVSSIAVSKTPARPVAVVYADWRLARAPEPEKVLALAVDNACPALLIDTWNKSAGNLFDHWPPAHLETFVDRARAKGAAVVLAGSLVGSMFDLALDLQPDLVAVRTAACDGGRNGTVRADLVRALHVRCSRNPLNSNG